MDSAVTTDRPLSLFYSYSHRDEAFRRELGSHLSFLRRMNLSAEWHDGMIDAGDDWKRAIDRELALADVVLLLVSADFIDSDYCWSEEMTKALARHAAGEARVVPVILRACKWESTPIGQLQAVPKYGQPISEWPSRDAAFKDVAIAVERIINDLLDQRRRAAEAAEAARVAEQQRRQAEEEARRREVEERQRREREVADARQQAEAARVAEEQRRQAEEEAKRREEEERLRREREAEEARQRAEVARVAEERRRQAEEDTKQQAEQQRRERAAEEARRREKAETASASPAAAPSPGAEEAPPSPASGRGFVAAAEDQNPLPRAGEVGALAPGEGAAAARSGTGKPRSRFLAITAVIAVVGIVGYVVTSHKEHGADRPQTSPAPSTAAVTPKPLDTFRDCPDCPKMVAIPGGTFTMGSPASEEGSYDDEGPQRKVTIQAFAIGQTEVTFDQWDACVAAGGCNGYRPDDAGWGRGSRPVINVSWQDAQAFVKWLSKRTGKPYRLPTEAEWEYATRAGTTTPFSFGATISTAQANYDGNYTYGAGSKGEYRQKTVPAGSLPANVWSLYETHGNVWEWVQDCYYYSYQGAPVNGSAWMSGDCAFRVARGGSWNYYPRYLRSASRISYVPDLRIFILGFRVARTLAP